MVDPHFQDLFDDVSRLMGLEPQPLLPDAHGIVGFELRLPDCPVHILQAVEAPPASALLIADFGLPPAGRELQVLQSVLDANFLLAGPGAVGFARNPASGSLCLHYARALQDMSAGELRQSATNLARLARLWKADFLEGCATTGEALTPDFFA